MREGWMNRRELLTIAGGAVIEGVFSTSNALASSTSGELEAVDEWRMYGYDKQNIGLDPIATGPMDAATDGKPFVERKWKTTVESTVATAVTVDEDTAYVGTTEGIVHAIAAASGEEGWSTTVGGEIDAGVAVHEDTVFVGANQLHALDRSTGVERWDYAVPAAMTGPTVHDGTVILGVGNSVHAVDAADGEAIWESDVDGDIVAPPGVSPDGDRHFVNVDTGSSRIRALDTATGEELWQDRIDRSTANFGTAPTVLEDAVLTGRSSLIRYDHDGTEVWASSVENALTGTAVVEDRVYATTTDGVLHAISLTTGDELWNQTLGDRIPGAPAIADGVVYVAVVDDDRGQLYAIEEGLGAGALITRFDTDEEVRNGPSIVDENLYFSDDSGTVYSLRENIKQREDLTTADEWPSFGYDVRNVGRNPQANGAVDPDPTGRPYLQVEWEAAGTDPIASFTTIAGNTAYFVGEEETLYAVDTSDGSSRWEVETDQPIVSGPTVDGDRVYVSTTGYLHALSTDGSIKWKYQALGGIDTAPVVRDEVVYLAAGNSIHAVDAADGEAIWESDVDGDIVAPPGVSPDGDRHFVNVDTGSSRIRALDTATGEELWQDRIDRSTASFGTEPTVLEDAVLTGRSSLIRYDHDGTEVWASSVENALTGTAVGDGRVYAATTDGVLHGFNIETGDEIWRQELGSELPGAPVWLEDDSMVYTVARTEDGSTVYALDDFSGEIRQTRSIDEGARTPIAIVDGALYFGTEDGSVYAFVDDLDEKRPIEAYANEDGIVESQGVIAAFTDWQAGEISAELLIEAFSAWQTGEKVV